MGETSLKKTLDGITPGDEISAQKARARWDEIAKPLHSLGVLEDMIVRIAAAQHDARVATEKKVILPVCADNGITAEGVTQTGPSVTAEVAANFLSGDSCISCMCRTAGADLHPVDLGMITEVPGMDTRKIARGTKNFAKEPAMTKEQALLGIETGIALAGEMKEAGYDLIAAGEMGIGNTTTAAAVVSALLSLPAENVTGRGAGLSEEGYRKKIRVIREAVERWDLFSADPVTVLSHVGGFDLAGITGLFLGGALCQMPVLIDGMISGAGALLAARLNPAASDYMIATHRSAEPAAALILKELHLTAPLDASMSLGEGSGAAAVFPLIDMAAGVYHDMITFSDAGIAPYQPFT